MIAQRRSKEMAGGQFGEPKNNEGIGPLTLFLKNLFQLIVSVFKAASAMFQSWLSPQEAARRRFEIERLDRIRHPSKYLGK